MCQMLQNLLQLRPEMGQTFEVGTEAGLADAIAWMFVRALPELGICEQVDESTLQALNATVSYFPTPKQPIDAQAADESGGVIALSVLMGLVWRHRPDVRQLFDIAIPAERAKYLVWFVTHGVCEMGLQPLVSAPWRQWLREITVSAGGLALPRLGLACWIAREDLQQAFDLTTPRGQAGLQAWTAASFARDPGWQWLTAEKPEDGLPGRHRWGVPSAMRGVNLVGFALGELGLGEDVRMAALACESAGIPYSVVNIETGPHTRQQDASLRADVEADARAPYPINLFCLTAFDTARACITQGAGLFDHRYNIGWWPWELPVWPDRWKAVFGLVDEVWAATQFTYGLYRSVAPVPTLLMPPAAAIRGARVVPRREFGLPMRKFLFLYIFDFNSHLARKNPMAALRAFRKAFDLNDGSVGLVFKTMNTRSGDPAWLDFKHQCGKDPRVIIMEQTLDHAEVLSLIEACDAYLSLHRSEGFGRTLAEAMLCGKPVVGTDFSGNVDFLTLHTGFPVKWKRKPLKAGEYPFVEVADAAWWAEPNTADAAKQMRAARAAAQDIRYGEHVKALAVQQFSPARIGALMKDRINQIPIQAAPLH